MSSYRTTTDRHDRETLAKVAKDYGISRELLRKAGFIRRAAEQTESPELAELAGKLLAAVGAGRLSTSRAYWALTDDGTRVPMFLKLPTVLDDEVRRRAGQLGCSRQLVVESTLTMALLPHIFGEAAGGGRRG